MYIETIKKIFDEIDKDLRDKINSDTITEYDLSVPIFLLRIIRKETTKTEFENFIDSIDKIYEGLGTFILEREDLLKVMY